METNAVQRFAFPTSEPRRFSKVDVALYKYEKAGKNEETQLENGAKIIETTEKRENEQLKMIKDEQMGEKEENHVPARSVEVFVFHLLYDAYVRTWYDTKRPNMPNDQQTQPAVIRR